MWIVTTDEMFEATTRVFETLEEAEEDYAACITEREFAGETYRVFLAKVEKVSDQPEPWRMEE